MNIRVVLPAAVVLGGACITARAIRTVRYTLRDKVAVITGGSRGLGLVLARHICARGGRVALIARDPEALARAKADLAPHVSVVLTIECDLLDAEQIESAVRQIIDRFGKIDILINNAGIIEVGPIEHMTPEDFERAMRVHFWAPFELISQIVPEMRIWGGGRIVNISSIGGKVAVPHLAPYSASKFALTGLSDAIRAELARDNIHVTTVAPGMMRTGSHVNARFKGKHDMEFAWFAAPAEAANHANSMSCLPLNLAFTWDPVRIIPGATVVTWILSRASSARIASDKPVRANLLALYGARCGTATLPPIEEILTMRPPPQIRISGMIREISSYAAQKCSRMARSKSSRVMFSNGPTSMMPALLIKMSILPNRSIIS